MLKNLKTMGIVLSFKREENLDQVVEGLRNQSFIDDILIIHNCPSKKRVKGCYNIVSDINFGCLIRHQIAATLNGYGYFIFSDDDLMLTGDITDSVSEAVEKVGRESVLGIYGLNLNRNDLDSAYSTGKNIRNKKDVITPVDIVKGRFHIMSKNNVMRLASSRFNTKFLREEDDIRANVSTQNAHKVPSYVFRVSKNQVLDLPDPNALQDRPDHYDNRNRAILDGIVLGWEPIS